MWDRVSELFIKGVCNLCCDGRFVVKGNSMIFVCVHFFVGKIFYFSIGCVCFFCDPSFHQDVTSIVQSYGVVCLM